ncbi:MAG: hypothetical protein WAN86_23220 [Hyphomicrobiaceae bacterium]
MNPKMDIKEDALADVDLASLMQRRAEAVEKQKKATNQVQTAKAGHFLCFWLGGGAMALAALWLAQKLPEYSPSSMFFLSTCIVFWLGMWTAAFFPAGAVRRLQDKATAATRQVMELDLKIAFSHQVREEARRVKVHRYAEALVEKEAAPKKPAAG